MYSNFNFLQNDWQGLAKIGEIAGQLGIKTENIVDFTKTIADLGATTNLSAEEGATSLAQFMAVMGTSQDKIRNLGSTIVELGNNFATNEKAIVEMSQRLSGMGKQTNMTEADVLGLAAAMSTVGIEAEAGGSAMTQTMTKMQNAVMGGGKELAAFAKAAGVSTNEFAKAFNDRPVQALEMVLKGLENVKKSGGNVNDVLESLGIKGIREADAMKRLAGALNGDSGLGKALEIANELELDLVEISPNATPPVCKVIDYKKFLYEQKKREKEMKAKATKVVIKEIRFGPQTDDHDYEFKKKHGEKFLKEGSKVKAYVFFKGRSIIYKDQGEILLLRLATDLEDYGKVEQMPKLEGKRMTMFLAPLPKKK